jgi:hypothetical protein
MTTYREITNQVADQWVAAMKNAEAVIDSVSEGARLAESATPEQGADFVWLEKLNEVISEHLPQPAEIVEANFEFNSRLLAAQRDLTLKLLEANAPKAGAPKAAQSAKKA